MSTQTGTQTGTQTAIQIGVVGAGNVGVTLARRFAEAGHRVVIGVRDEAKAPALPGVASGDLAGALAAEVIVIATPWRALADVAASGGGLPGRIVVDCTNAFGGGLPDGVRSTAALLAAAAPRARIVKAFNSVGWEVMANPVYGGGVPIMPYCGDDAEAKQTVRGLIGDLGFEAIDVGPLANAWLTESMAQLWGQIAYTAGLGREVAWALLRR